MNEKALLPQIPQSLFLRKRFISVYSFLHLFIKSTQITPYFPYICTLYTLNQFEIPVNENTILNIIKLRFAVYYQGCKANQWKSIEVNNASTLLEYIFPKTGRLAYYNLILEQMRTLHRDYIPSGKYFLFNMPVQFEEQMLNYLKNHSDITPSTIVDDPEAFLASWATVACDNSLSPVNIGAIKDTDMESLLHVMAVYYKAAFENNCNCYPYFS